MLNNLLRKFLSYSSSCEDGSLGTYNCDPCPIVDSEFARVRGVALVKESYLPTLLAAPTLAATWTTGITAGNIIIMPFTSGSYDPGDPTELPGFGDVKSTSGPREMQLNWNDPNYKINYGFYNGFSKTTSYVPAFRTSSLIHIFDKPAQLTAKDPVEDDIEARVVWQGLAKVTSENLPSKHDATNLTAVFKCN
jgi:hypothetical protein